ncbi:MAG: SDR family oxidoreductase [Gammaproteobacteria bacterium]|nr:SDR family oxidoreductase [Gammaproteobacteria bacterium]
MSESLAGSVAIVTGASSGIGRATAVALAGAGAAVAVAARRGDRLDEVVAGIRRDGGRALAVATDVADRKAVFALVERAAAEFGPADILVNNAGIMPTSPLRDIHLDDWLRMVDVNVKGVLHCIAAALPAMLERRRGHIVNVGSVAGRRPFPGGTVYAATKFAVRCMSAGMQLELSAAHGIRITDIQPGVVATELVEHIPDPETREGFIERWQDKRPMDPEDVAAAILYVVTAPAHVNINEILMRPSDQPT